MGSVKPRLDGRWWPCCRGSCGSDPHGSLAIEQKYVMHCIQADLWQMQEQGAHQAVLQQQSLGLAAATAAAQEDITAESDLQVGGMKGSEGVAMEVVLSKAGFTEVRNGGLTNYAVDQTGRWRRSLLLTHRKAHVNITVCLTAYEALELPSPGLTSVKSVSASCNTKARIAVGGPEDVQGIRLLTARLLKPKMDIKTGNGESDNVQERVFISISGLYRPGWCVSNKQLMYVMQGVQELYLKRDLSVAIGKSCPSSPSICEFSF